MEPLYRIQGGGPLRGEVLISGAKNASLPCLAATLLTDEPCTIRNLPAIADGALFLEILEALGAEVAFDAEAHTATVRAAKPLAEAPPDRLVANQRASFLVMGPLLAREGRGACAAPGGDIIGQRPLDVHLRGFHALGADVRTEGKRFVATAASLRGSRVVLDYPSVLGTENLLLAAVLAEGETVIVNAAAEPEIVDLASMLTAMGAQIRGAGSHTITVAGVKALRGVEHTLIPDRIETGSYAVAAAITGGDLMLKRDSRLIFPLCALLVGTVSLGIQALVVLDFLHGVYVGDWLSYAEKYNVEPPAMGPEAFCFGFCFPDLPFHFGCIGLGSIATAFVSLIYIYWRPSEPID